MIPAYGEVILNVTIYCTSSMPFIKVDFARHLFLIQPFSCVMFLCFDFLMWTFTMSRDPFLFIQHFTDEKFFLDATSILYLKQITENRIIEIWQVFKTLNNRLLTTRFYIDKIIISNKLEELSSLLNKLLVLDVFKNFVYFLETEFYLCPRKTSLFSHYLCFSLRFAKNYILWKII